MHPSPERAVLPDHWQGASLDPAGAVALVEGGPGADPLDDAPAEVKREIFENRQRNLAGLCFRAGCGRPLADDTGCAAHGEHRAHDAAQLEARARRLGILPAPTTRRAAPRRRYW